jgi:hypothetical protein
MECTYRFRPSKRIGDAKAYHPAMKEVRPPGWDRLLDCINIVRGVQGCQFGNEFVG